MTHKGKRAIVTGAAQGIGLAIATRLAKEGAKVAMCDINLEKTEAAAGALRAEGYDTQAFRVDVSRIDQLPEAFDGIAAALGGLDILVNNAGILDNEPLGEVTEATWDRVLGVDLKGLFFMSQAALPHLEKSGCPRIVNIASVAGRMGGYESGYAYTAAKGGVISLTKRMARQVAPKGITINAVCPGTTESDIIKVWSKEQIDGLKSRIPLDRLGHAEDMAAAVAFLSSEDAAFITGTALDVNGGMFMG